MRYAPKVKLVKPKIEKVNPYDALEKLMLVVEPTPKEILKAGKTSKANKPELLYITKQLQSSGSLVVGFEMFKEKRTSFFCEIKFPKLERDIETAILLVKKIVGLYPTIEFYIQQEINHMKTFTDWQNGIVFDKDHKIIKYFKPKGAIGIMQEEINLINKCTNKHNTSHFYAKPDFDYLYQNL